MVRFNIEIKTIDTEVEEEESFLDAIRRRLKEMLEQQNLQELLEGDISFGQLLIADAFAHEVSYTGLPYLTVRTVQEHITLSKSYPPTTGE